MQRPSSFFNGSAAPNDAHKDQCGGHYTYGGTSHEFQATNICPRNYVIFDQMENKNRVMFHPDLTRNLNYPYDLNNCAENENQDDMCSFLKENTADIDALMSSDEEDEDDDLVSTGRSPVNYSSFDTASSSGCDEIKREKMRKMVNVLRGILPGGERMDTCHVLDESVKYLKSLKVEVNKLGILDL